MNTTTLSCALTFLAMSAGCSGSGATSDPQIPHRDAVDAAQLAGADSGLGIITSLGTGGAGATDAGSRIRALDASAAGSGGVTGTRDASSASDAAASSALDASTPGPTAGGASMLPVPPGPTNVSKPNAGGPDLRVLPWAGFSAAASYTFDDSQPSQIAHYAELDATGVPVTFYITSSHSNLAGYADTWKDALGKGHELGNHTVHHCNFDLSECTAPLASADEEIDQCTQYLTTQVGAPNVWTFASPYGDKAYESAAQQRFFLERGVNDGMIGPADTTDPFDLPVKAAAGGESADVFSADIDAARAQGKWVIFLFHSLLPTDQNWFAGVEIGSVTGSIAHAKDAGDVWIDTLAHVGAYWVGQRTLEAATPVTDAQSAHWSWTLPPHFPPGTYLRVTVAGGTLKQGSDTLAWDSHGYYEVALDRGSLDWSR